MMRALAFSLCLLAAGCEHFFARGTGGSSGGLDNVEVGIPF